MKRTLETDLIAWKNQSERMPLLLRGARQVGKTYTITAFGKTHFENIVMINFELQREYLACFQNLDPYKITTAISAISRLTITPGKTLLFLDEIQECPQAIMSLRYFKELMPDLHVIGAGSLLEFALKDETFRMPVGRVQSLYLKPLSFYEYLTAQGYNELKEYLSEITFKEKFDLAIHTKLESLLREYFIIGGMPAVVERYLKHKNLIECQNIQIALLSTFRNDFGKYATYTKHKYLQAIFDKTPGMIAEHFRYVTIDPHMQSRDLKLALDQLLDAGIIYKVFCTSASGLPLNALINEKKFKLLFLDVGLVKTTSLLDAEIMLKNDLMLINHGKLVEQFVGQELLANSTNYLPGQLFFWEREKRGSTAEVDYIIQFNDKIIPVEVKAGKSGKMRSLRVFLEEKKSSFGIRVSLNPLEFQHGILSIPLYMLHELKRLCSLINP